MNSLERKINVLLLLPLFLLFFCLYIPAHAQSIGNTSLDGIDISSTPANPSPGDAVTVTVQSYSTDLNRALITWSVNGISTTKGNGIVSLNVVAPAIGKSVQVVASVHTAEGGDIQKSATVRSGDIDLIWETSGFTPPFYRGRTPVVYQNTIKFTAIPHLVDKNGKPIDPKNLIYNWSDGSTAFGDQSGYGKQTLIIKGSIIPRPLDINVQVISTDQSASGQAAIEITPTAPSITFYQEDPLYGVLYNTSIGSALRLSHNEIKIVAAPFGFDVGDKQLAYNWSINDVTQDSTAATGSIVLRVGDGQEGTSNIGLTLQNAGNNILQGATASFNAIFTTPKQNSTSVAF